MRVVLDGTPLLGADTGVGRYTRRLLDALASRGDLDLTAIAFTLRGAGTLARSLPADVAARRRPAPTRALRKAWSSTGFPPVELLAGRADVFHATNLVLPPTSRAGGVLTIHDLGFLNTPGTADTTGRDLRELVPRSLGRAAVVCTPTRTLAEKVLDAYGPRVSRIEVTPPGVDAEWLTVTPPSPADRRRLSLPDRYFLFVGAHESPTDLSTLLAAYARFRAYAGADPTVPALVLVGPAGESSPAGVQVRQHLPSADLRPAVAGATAVVLPSSDEGFDLPALEALAAGVPVIVGATPALLEVTGGMAAHFPVGEPEALAAELVRAADGLDAGVAARAAAARRAYAAGWTWERCAEATVRAYRAATR